jgi:acyl-coenzyme A thioesterase PaaI-like protein
MPFTRARQLSVEHMAGGTSRLTLPLIEANGGADGSIHEGAALALLDTTGAMAAWGVTGPGPFKASTAALQAQMLGRADQELVGFGRVVHRAGDLFWVDVDLAERGGGGGGGRLVGRGTVIYRIVT